jgi:F-type H+/Na+-transporting ATPase subunit alpha
MSDSEIVILSEAQREALSKNLLENAKLTTSKEDFLNTVVTRVELGDKLDRDPGISELIKTLSTRSQQIKTQVRFTSVGTVHRIGNGVATVSGLPNVSIDEIVTFPTGMEGMALNLDRKHVDLIMLGSEEGIRGGDLVEATGKRLQIPVGSQLLGRVVDPWADLLIAMTELKQVSTAIYQR